MKSLLLGSKGQLGRHFGVAVGVVAMFAAACGGASAQPVSVTVMAANTTPSPPPWCSKPQGGYIVCVDRDPIQTPGAAGDDVTIVWNLASSGWTFVKNKGIDIKNKKNWKLKEDSATQYTATNKKEGGVQYKYEINVTNGAVSPTWDPTIMN